MVGDEAPADAAANIVLDERPGVQRLEGTVCLLRGEFGFVKHPDFDNDFFFHLQCTRQRPPAPGPPPTVG